MGIEDLQSRNARRADQDRERLSVGADKLLKTHRGHCTEIQISAGIAPISTNPRKLIGRKSRRRESRAAQTTAAANPTA